MIIVETGKLVQYFCMILSKFEDYLLTWVRTHEECILMQKRAFHVIAEKAQKIDNRTKLEIKTLSNY